jgi:hypothetical protein
MTLRIPESQMQMILESPSLLPDVPVTAALNRMTRMLKHVRPATDAEALRLLRAAFPQSSLADRIAALARHAGDSPVPIS